MSNPSSTVEGYDFFLTLDSGMKAGIIASVRQDPNFAEATDAEAILEFTKKVTIDEIRAGRGKQLIDALAKNYENIARANRSIPQDEDQKESFLGAITVPPEEQEGKERAHIRIVGKEDPAMAGTTASQATDAKSLGRELGPKTVRLPGQQEMFNESPVAQLKPKADPTPHTPPGGGGTPPARSIYPQSENFDFSMPPDFVGSATRKA